MFFMVLDEVMISRSFDHKLYPDQTLPELYYWLDALRGQNSNKNVHSVSLSVIAKAYDVLIDLKHACERTITLLTWG